MATQWTKSEQMALRRLTSNGLPPSTVDKPYYALKYPDFSSYLVAHACFTCRKSWKRPDDSQAPCPECGGVLHWMGRSFKAPKQRDREQWQKVAALWNYGFRFRTYGLAPDIEPLPDRLRDVDGFVHRNPRHPDRIRR